MHRRKTPKSINKPPPIQGAAKNPTPPTLTNNESGFDGDKNIQFEVELCWCVQQLQTALDSGKLNQKVAADTAKNLKILTSQTAPLIKKRQVMMLSMGDYRAKMQEEEKKMALATKQIKFTNPSAATVETTSKKSSFVKRSSLLKSGNDFRFNFSPPGVDNPSSLEIPPKSTAPRETAQNSFLSLTTATAGEEQFKFNFIVDPEEDINQTNDINICGLKLNG